MKKRERESPRNVFDVLDHDSKAYLVDQISASDMFPLALACKTILPLCKEKKVDGRWTTSYSDSPGRLAWAIGLPNFARPSLTKDGYVKSGFMAYACANGFLDTLKYALERFMIRKARKIQRYFKLHDKSRFNDGQAYFWSPIHYAAQFGRTEVVEWLLDNKVDFIDSPVILGDVESSQRTVRQRCRSYLDNAVCVAAQHGHISTVEYLYRQGGSLFSGTGAMLAAARGGKLHVIDWLIRHATLSGYDPLKPDSSWLEVVQGIAYSGPTLEKVKWMCQRFVRHDTGDDVKLALCAHGSLYERLLEQPYERMLDIIQGYLLSFDTDILQFMYEHGMNFEFCDLHEIAVENDDIESFKWLMGVVAPEEGLLRFAACNNTGNTECLQYLISAGVESSSLADALADAIREKNYATALVLFENGAGRQLNGVKSVSEGELRGFLNEARRRRLHKMIDRVLCRSPAKLQEIETLLLRL